MSMTTKIRYGIAGMLLGLKQSDIAFIPQWIRQSWAPATFTRLTAEGYKKNAAVNICLTKLALGYQQPRPLVKSLDGDPLPTHPLQKLLIRPNPQMSWRELALITAVYKGIGGNCYLKKVRSKQGLVVELWPYHMGQMRPVPGQYEWIKGYEYSDGEHDWQPIDKEDIVHLKWPIVDPDQPWMALSPLIALAREVDTDNEATRYQHALLANDATPRTAIKVPVGQRPMLPDERERAKAAFRQKYGGDNRGDVAILENGADIVRLNLNMEELAFDALRKVPEARISAGFLIPPEYSGLTVGLEHSTYNNVNEARRGFFEDTIVQLLALDAGELEQDLGADFGGNLIIEHDLSKVVALQENEDAKHARANTGWTNGLLKQNEARRMIGLADEPGGDVFKGAPMLPAPGGESAPKTVPILGYHIESGVVSKNEARAQLGLSPEDESQDEKLRGILALLTVVQAAVNVRIPLESALEMVGLQIAMPAPIDVTPPPFMDAPPEKRQQKAAPQQTIERRIEKAMSTYLTQQYERAANAVG